MFSSAISGVFRPVDAKKITRINYDGVDSGRSHRIAFSGYDEHFVPINGELCGAHSAQGAHNTEPVPPAELHIYLSIRCVGGLSSILQHTIILIKECKFKIPSEFQSSHYRLGR